MIRKKSIKRTFQNKLKDVGCKNNKNKKCPGNARYYSRKAKSF